MVVIDRVEAVAKESMADAVVAFELTVNGDASSTPTRFEMQTGVENVRVPVPIVRPGTVHIRMFAPASKHSAGSGWQVINPRLVHQGSCP
jgi:hypothetical protein